MSDPTLRLSLLQQLDRAYADYSVRVKPDEARAFIQSSMTNGEKNDAQVYQLLILLDETIPLANRGEEHPATGRVCHTYRIGREVGKRVLTLELSKINFESMYATAGLTDILEGYARTVKALMHDFADDNGRKFDFLWL